MSIKLTFRRKEHAYHVDKVMPSILLSFPNCCCFSFNHFSLQLKQKLKVIGLYVLIFPGIISLVPNKQRTHPLTSLRQITASFLMLSSPLCNIRVINSSISPCCKNLLTFKVPVHSRPIVIKILSYQMQ